MGEAAMALGTVAVPSIDEVRSRLREYLISESGRTQASVAKSIGISASALSSWMGGTYRGDVEALASKIGSFLSIEGCRAVAPKTSTFVSTAIAEQVMEVCRFAHIHRDIGLVYGEAGMGKTVALRRYCREHRDAIYVRCDPSSSSAQATLEAVAIAMGRRPRWGGLRRFLQELVDALEETGRVLILDEAQFLTLRGLETLRALHDRAEIGMVLCGNFEVFSQLHGEGKASFAQLFSRVGIRRQVTLTGATAEDVMGIARQISSDLAADCEEYLVAKSRERGGLRRMVKVLRLGFEMASGEGLPVSVRHLRTAEVMLIGGKAEARR
jgi:DNA transposition AAA+ family ATPase